MTELKWIIEDLWAIANMITFQLALKSGVLLILIIMLYGTKDGYKELRLKRYEKHLKQGEANQWLDRFM